MSLRALFHPRVVAVALFAATIGGPTSVTPVCAQSAKESGTAWAAQSGAACPIRAEESSRTASALARIRAQVAAVAGRDAGSAVVLNGSGYNYRDTRTEDPALLEYESRASSH